MHEIYLHLSDRDEARAHLRHEYPGCVLWPTARGFDVLVPQHWENGKPAALAIASTASITAVLA